jgi:hypothetical protein
MREIIKVENIDGILVTTSNRVAKELGVEHKNLIAKIDSYIDKFTRAKSSAVDKNEFYIESTYQIEGNFKNYKNYLITEKGVAQLLGGYSSAVEKAFELNVAYINEFERMKKYILSQQQNPYINMSPQELMIETLKEQEKMKKEFNNKFDELEEKIDNKITINSYQQRRIQRLTSERVRERIKARPELKGHEKLLFGAIYRRIKDTFGVPSYKDLLEKDIDDCFVVINSFIEDKYILEGRD